MRTAAQLTTWGFVAMWHRQSVAAVACVLYKCAPLMQRSLALLIIVILETDVSLLNPFIVSKSVGGFTIQAGL